MLQQSVSPEEQVFSCRRRVQLALHLTLNARLDIQGCMSWSIVHRRVRDGTKAYGATQIRAVPMELSPESSTVRFDFTACPSHGGRLMPGGNSTGNVTLI